MAQAAARRHLPPGAPSRPVPRWIGPLLASGLVLAVAAAFAGVYWEGYEMRRQTARLVHERDALLRQNALLREEVRLLNTPEYIERLAREQLGLMRPEELALILVRPTPTPAPPAPEQAPAGRPVPWWARLLERGRR